MVTKTKLDPKLAWSPERSAEPDTADETLALNVSASPPITGTFSQPHSTRSDQVFEQEKIFGMRTMVWAIFMTSLLVGRAGTRNPFSDQPGI